MRIKLIYFLLPFILWPATFLLFREHFMYSMFISTLLLFSLTITYFRDTIPLEFTLKSLVAGLASAIILYLAFYSGNYIASLIGFGGYVRAVYNMIASIENQSIIPIGLAFIGLFEEVYWRGGLQENIAGEWKWVYSTAIYTTVHISTLNPILVIAAFIVGLVLGLTAEKYTIVASTLAHILWLELIIVLYPPPIS